MKAARDAGFEPLGASPKAEAPRSAGTANHRLTELHIEPNGDIRKMKPVEGGDPKWSQVL